MSDKKQAIKSVLFNYLGYFSRAILSFIATPIIIHSLGNAKYGIWSLVISMTGYYGLLNFGMRSALTKYIAEFNAKKDIDEVNKLINTSLVFFVSIAAGLLSITYIVSIYFKTIFILEDIDLNTIQIVILLTGLNVSLGFIFQPFDTLLVAFNRFDIVNKIGVISSIVRTTLLVTVLKMDFGLIGMALTILCVDLITFGVIIVASKKVFGSLSLSYSLINKNTFNRLLNFGAFNFLRHISKIILQRTDVIIIGIFMGPAMVAVYSIAESLVGYSGLITKGVANVVLPLSSRLSALNQSKKIKQLMVFIPKYAMPISVFIAIQFYFLGSEFITLWIGKGYEKSYVVLCLLMISKVGMMSHDSMVETVAGMGHNKFIGFLSMFEAISNIMLSLFLVKIYGLVGVALGTVIPLTITRFFVVPLYCCRLVGVSLRTYFDKVLYPTLLFASFCLLVTYISTHFIPPVNYFWFIVNTTISLIGFVLFFCRFVDPRLTTKIHDVIGLAMNKARA